MSRAILTFFVFIGICSAASDRIARPIDRRHVRVVQGAVPRLAQAQFDRGAADPSMPLEHVTLMVKLSASQQAGLEQLLAAQQNPSSALFRKWLTPEEFGNRFGLSAGDRAKVAAWLAAEGFQVKEPARGGNWIAFSATAGQVAAALHTSIRRYQVNGRMHFANSAAPSVPEALAGVVEGFLGLDDFPLQSQSKLVSPELNSGTQHYLAPEDFATIYDLAPLYKAGLDGSGQSMVVIGASDVVLSDLRAFRTRYNLPANDPKMVLYSSDPGLTGAQLEGNLDLEWAGAIAPKATIYYVYGPSPFSAFISAVNSNIAPVISISYGDCETDYRPGYYRSIAQQANAQGITIVAAAGDSGGAGCSPIGSSMATLGATALFPAILPEVTGVGGTQFVEGADNYWAASNSANFGSALSYIPEAAWNETSDSNGILAGGGGVSRIHPQPAWQQGPGVPTDGFRHYPDVAFSAALHDGYFVNFLGGNGAVGGTSAGTPAMAAIVALLNQYQAAKGLPAGLGNINPQLYRLAQSAPPVFHDIVAGNNAVPCAQATPDCLTGFLGYAAAAGYDMATGLGSIDVNSLVTQWNSAVRGVTVNLVVSTTRAAVNDIVNATALVAGVPDGTPTGGVDFSINGAPLGSAPLVARGIQGQAADISFPAYLTGGTGLFTLTATYSGDTAFSTGGAVKNLSVIAGSGASAIVITAPNTVWPAFPDAQGLGWQTTLTLREAAGVASIVTSFAIDGQAQPLATYFPSTDIPAGGSISVDVVLRSLATPLLKTFRIDGVDATGHAWTRQVSVNYLGMPSAAGFYVTASPLTVVRNRGGAAGCEWPVEISVDELDGYATEIVGLWAGGISLADRIVATFGTDRLAAWGSLQGTVCFTGINPPATSYLEVDGVNGFVQEVLVSFADAPATPGTLAESPAMVSLSAPGATASAQATLAVNLADKTQTWTASVYPGNRTTGWLTLSARAGTGPGQIALAASGAGYGPGAYRALIVIQSPNAVPQSVTVPVMFVLGGGGPGITSVSGAVSSALNGAPGGLLSIYGAQLARTTQSASGSPMPSALAGVSAVVNGIGAPVLYVSPNQVNIQIPFEAGAGPAVLGLNNNGQIAGFPFQVASAAPGIFTDGDGMIIPQANVQTGKTATLLLTGAGEASLGLPTAFATSPNSPLAAGPKPMLPLSITVGGVPAFVQTAAVAPGQVGIVQVNFMVPASVPAGQQAVVVTVGGVPSTPVKLVVQP